MANQRRDDFDCLCQEFNTISDYIFQDGLHLKLIYLSIFHIKYIISIDQTEHIIKIILDKYWKGKDPSEILF